MNIGSPLARCRSLFSRLHRTSTDPRSIALGGDMCIMFKPRFLDELAVYSSQKKRPLHTGLGTSGAPKQSMPPTCYEGLAHSQRGKTRWVARNELLNSNCLESRILIDAVAHVLQVCIYIAIAHVSASLLVLCNCTHKFPNLSGLTS